MCLNMTFCHLMTVLVCSGDDALVGSLVLCDGTEKEHLKLKI